MMRVYKIGGSVVEDGAALDRFCRDFAALPGDKVLVHGGGVTASALQRALGSEPVKIEGRRVTDADALKAAVFAYAGWCNKILVATLQKYGCNAIGLAGCDANVITAARRAPLTLSDGRTVVDFGYVGDVCRESVNADVIRGLCDMGTVPVLCAINHDGEGQLLNTNADTIASSVAAATGAGLVCCFEMDGVLERKDDPSSLIRRISAAEFERLKADGTVTEGMIPKIENCLYALRNGACSARIMNASSITGDVCTEIIL